MKEYKIKVNGNEYNVSVEEVGGTISNVSVSAPTAAPSAAPAVAPKAAAAPASARVKHGCQRAAAPGGSLQTVYWVSTQRV